MWVVQRGVGGLDLYFKVFLHLGKGEVAAVQHDPASVRHEYKQIWEVKDSWQPGHGSLFPPECVLRLGS